MSDLISRQTAIERLTDIRICLDDESQQFMDLLIREISDLPSAEPKRGKWEQHIFDGIMGRRPSAWMCDNCNGLNLFKTDFCPNCGADMRKRGE